MRAEIEDFSAVEAFHGRVEGLKSDVFGPVAIATGAFLATFRIGDEPGWFALRTTLVFVESGGEWLIAHEHHSPFTASS